MEEVIVGFESTSNEELKSYEKTTDALDYPKVIEALNKENIDLTALFMVNPDYGLKDFIEENNMGVNLYYRYQIKIGLLQIYFRIRE